MKYELGKLIKTKFVGLWGKAYGYLIDDSSKNKKKGTIKCVIKKNLNKKIIKTV